MKENIILSAICFIIGFMAVLLFQINNKKGFKFKNKPDFKPLKLDKEKINEQSKI